MTHRGPFQPLLFCDSVILFSAPNLLQSPLNLLNQILQPTKANLELLQPNASALLSWFSLELFKGLCGQLHVRSHGLSSLQL